MNLLIPRDILNWIDEKRGDMSRQSFILSCMRKLLEIDKL